MLNLTKIKSTYKMKKIINSRSLIIIYLFLASFSLYAQNVLDRLDPLSGGVLFRNKVFNKNSEQVKGTPYLNDEFTISEITGANKLFLTRYNIYKDEVEISYENETFIIPKDKRFDTIWNKNLNYKLVLTNYTSVNDENTYGYLIELFSEKETGLFKREKIILIPARESGNSYSRSVPSSYNKINPDFYLKTNSETIIPFPKNKKALITLYPKNSQNISKYLNDAKISFKKEADLIKLTKFIGTL